MSLTAAERLDATQGARLGAALWTAAAVVALAAHAALALWILALPPPDPQQALPAGAIAFELAPTPSGPDEGVDEPRPDSPAPEPVEEPAPEEDPPAEQVDLPEPDAEAEAPQESVEDVPGIEEAAVPIPTPRPAYTPPQNAEQRERPVQRRQAAQGERPAQRQRSTATAAPAPAAAGQANAPRAAAPREGRTRQSPGVSPARWQAALLAHLERHKRYPRGARSRREQGTAQLGFSIDRRGHVTSARLVRSSGHPELDQAVLDMVRRASPVPAPPPEVRQLQFSVPVRFSLR